MNPRHPRSGHSIGARVFRLVASVGKTLRSRWAPGLVRSPLYESTVVEAFLTGQPVNIALKAIRRLLLLDRRESPGTTVVIVNYNTAELLRDVIPAIRRFSRPGTRIIVVDNASSGADWRWLRQRPQGITAIRLPFNIGHGRALDLGVLVAKTEVVITMDSDAFPFSPSWQDALVDPLDDTALNAVGARGRRDRLHPACAAFRRSAVIATGISFTNYKPHLDTGEEPEFGVNCWDTAELLFERLGRERVRLIPTAVIENGWGEVIGDVVYHHRAMTGYDLGATPSATQRRHERRRTWDQAVAQRLHQPLSGT